MDEVKSVMVQNIEKVLERGERIELLVDKTDSLKFQVRVAGGGSSCCNHPIQAEKFEKTGRQIRKNLWWQNVKLKVALMIVALVILGIIALAIYVAVKR